MVEQRGIFPLTYQEKNAFAKAKSQSSPNMGRSLSKQGRGKWYAQSPASADESLKSVEDWMDCRVRYSTLENNDWA